MFRWSWAAHETLVGCARLVEEQSQRCCAPEFSPHIDALRRTLQVREGFWARNQYGRDRHAVTFPASREQMMGCVLHSTARSKVDANGRGGQAFNSDCEKCQMADVSLRSTATLIPMPDTGVDQDRRVPSKATLARLVLTNGRPSLTLPPTAVTGTRFFSPRTPI